MVIAIPVEIARIVTGYVKDNKSLFNLLLVSHTFRRLAEPYLYTDVSFLAPFRQSYLWCQHEGRSDADLSAMARSFLCGITAGGGSCAHYVKRICLPSVAFREEQHALFQTILKLVPNLEDLQVHFSWWIEGAKQLNLRTFFEGSQLQSSSPPFALKSFAWYASDVQPDRIGLEWLLASQKSLECLSLPTLCSDSSPRSISSLPRLRILHISTIDVARRSLKANQVTHLMLEKGNLVELDDAALRNVVVCVTRRSPLDRLSAAAERMPNLECLEIDTSRSPIPKTLSRVGAFKGATKLHHLRFFSNQVLAQSEAFESYPWYYDDVVNVFDSLPSLAHISFLLSPATNFFEYCCFTRGTPRPVKLRSLRPGMPERAWYEWWHDWIEEYVVVPFEPSDPRMGYQGDFLP